MNEYTNEEKAQIIEAALQKFIAIGLVEELPNGLRVVPDTQIELLIQSFENPKN